MYGKHGLRAVRPGGGTWNLLVCATKQGIPRLLGASVWVILGRALKSTLGTALAVYLLHVLMVILSGTSCDLQDPCLQPTCSVLPVRCPGCRSRVLCVWNVVSSLPSLEYGFHGSHAVHPMRGS
jgi:hypothetical protein